MRYTPYVLASVLFACASVGDTAIAAEQDSPQPLTQHITTGPLDVEFSIDRDSMTAAQSATATLRVVSPAAVRVELPEIGEKLGGFAVESVSDAPSKAQAGPDQAYTIQLRTITLSPFLPGDYEVPTLEIRWRKPDSRESGVARTQPVTVHVRSLLPLALKGADAPPPNLDPGTIRDEYIAPAARRWSPITVTIFAGAALMGITVGAFSLMRRRSSHSPDPLQAIIQRTAALRAGATSPDAAIELCHSLATSLQSALVAKGGSSAASTSVSDLLAALENNPMFSPSHSKNIQSLLEQLDTARFSGESPAPRECEALVEKTFDILLSLQALPAAASPAEVTQ
jgi:hypothetical protein